MRHFSDEQWADFAGNLVPAATKMTMQQHLDGGCKSCAASLQLWQSVRAMAHQENALTPPADVVRVVKSQFAAIQPETSRGVRLVFDSSLQPIAAGIRGSVAARQFLFETDEYYIDLRLEPRRESERSCLVGQVLSRVGKPTSTEGVMIRLQDGKLPVAETTANRFGEFQLVFEAKEGLCVAISRKQESAVILPLYAVHVKPVERKDLD